MIASLFTPSLAVTLAVVLSLLLLRIGARAFQLRRRAEFARQLLELLQLATARQQALPPVLSRAAREARRLERRWLEIVASALENGTPLAESLGRVRTCFAPHVLAAIAAADGTATLPSVLADLARRHDHARELRYRVLMAASYPALLSLLLLALGSFWSMASWGVHVTDLEQADLRPWAVGAAILCSGVWLLLAFGWGHGRWSRLLAGAAMRLPWLGRHLRLLSAARALQATSSLVGSGAGLGPALEQAAHASGDGRLHRACLRAAGLAQSGASSDEVWRATGLPDFVVARAATMRSSPADLAGGLRDLAEQCQRRCGDSIRRSVSVMQPLAVVAFGLLVALQFSQVFAWLEVCRGIAMEQMPW